MSDYSEYSNLTDNEHTSKVHEVHMVSEKTNQYCRSQDYSLELQKDMTKLLDKEK